MRDAIPVTNDRLKRVVDGDRGNSEVLDLLQHRVGQSRHEGVAGDEQHGQAVGHGDSRRRHHVGRTGSDGRGAHHDLLAPRRLGESRRREAHSLFVLSAPDRQFLTVRFERVTETRHVSVPENPVHTGKQRHISAVDDCPLRDEEANERLGRRQANGLTCHESFLPGRRRFPRSSNPTNR